MATDPRDIQLTPEQQLWLAVLADQNDVAWPQLLANALHTYENGDAESSSNGGESLYDALKRDGYLGAVAGNPADMSTNPKYMEGFGESK